MHHKYMLPLLFSWSLFLGAGLTATPGQAASKIILSKGQTVYVPIYSHIYIGDRERPFLLAATLSVRNTDPDHPITILSVDYHDSDGKLIKRYLKEPRQLNSMGSMRYVVKESDKSGGSGAKFIVRWEAESEVNDPIIEGVMIGTKAQQGISFISRGRAIRVR
ncbi:MAG: DUF3124 domain-containing protein [Deltaproteobacteria bacterium]|nr:DUF3124 domain-containing protein [Deltaproteobacteria bacterium]MBW2047116.1 DUF3124 domain-containing protein [Deltaproteobacteria bacterium]MBW2109922.1 DUF3124 domain-containing protein [Deltaproteobacteria bacterium]MBW2351855.1 DUF3124 domain-containing protein [Deltaproteobacteria bacterium]HDZ90760.1 DUF3124 domain-containing protein [Deltaproteobacteria bacterium]